MDNNFQYRVRVILDEKHNGAQACTIKEVVLESAASFSVGLGS
jgi:hypothetical protein